MESSKLAELATANLELNRSLLQIQSAQIACNLTALKSQIALQTSDLALIRYQQAENSLALEIVRSQSSQVQLMITTEVELPEPLFRRLLVLLAHGSLILNWVFRIATTEQEFQPLCKLLTK
jgi:hypothetical protein